MKRMDWYPHQQQVLDRIRTNYKRNCALYLDCGLGKTALSCEQMLRYGNDYNLCIVQKSKVADWVEHFEQYTDMNVIDYTKKGAKIDKGVIVVNYELVWRREEFKTLEDFTLILDESSKVQHENTRQTKFIMSLKPHNVILASGTPCNGKYENLYSQIRLLGVNIPKKDYWNRYIDYDLVDNIRWVNGKFLKGRPYKKVNGYKNVDELITNLKKAGAIFMLSEDVLDLPTMNDIHISVKSTPEYRKFVKEKIVEFDGVEFVGDTGLIEMLRERQLCSSFNKHKLDSLHDLLESSDDRFVVYYNFEDDYNCILEICEKLGKPVSFVNGHGRDLKAYEDEKSSVTIIQYQSGSHGLNLQKANQLVFFSPPLPCEYFTQAKKRIHRLGQTKPCFYYYLTVENSIEPDIYENIENGIDYTLRLYGKRYENGCRKDL